MRADLVLYNGNNRTMDRARPRVRAASIAGNRIVAVGEDAPMRGLLAPGGAAADLGIPRLAELGVVASMQPLHATSDMEMARLHWGEERLRGAYAWRSLLDAGAVLAFGSDCPIETLDPFAVAPAAILEPAVEATFLDGRLVYDGGASDIPERLL